MVSEGDDARSTDEAAENHERRHSPIRGLPPIQDAIISTLSAPWARIVTLISRSDWDEGALLMVFGLVIGVAGGLGVVGFYHLIDLAYGFFITWMGDKVGVTSHVAYRPFLTALGLWGAF
jgi:hypothetical protein